ncbi:MAG TPA: thiamine pyrophosphate-dependent enzyme, partial [Pyrinomonadaceae bacterium]
MTARPASAEKLESLQINTPCWRLKATSSDVKSIDSRTLLVMLEQLILIRRFEEKLLKLSVASVLHGPAHSSIGQDGAAVGAMSALRSTDKINGTHRMHHQFLAKALNHVTAADYSPAQSDVLPAHADVVYRTYA